MMAIVSVALYCQAAIYLMVEAFIKMTIVLAMFRGEDNVLLLVFLLCCARGLSTLCRGGN